MLGVDLSKEAKDSGKTVRKAVPEVFAELVDMNVGELMQLLTMFKEKGIDVCSAGPGPAQPAVVEKPAVQNKVLKVMNFLSKANFIKAYKELANAAKIAGKGMAATPPVAMETKDAIRDLLTLPVEIEVSSADQLEEVKSSLADLCEFAEA